MWSFNTGGKVISRGRTDPGAMGRRDVAIGDAGVLTENEWSWKRLSNDSIELTHPRSGGAAFIRYSLKGNKLVLDWNNGSQILHLVKQ